MLTVGTFVDAAHKLPVRPQTWQAGTLCELLTILLMARDCRNKLPWSEKTLCGARISPLYDRISQRSSLTESGKKFTCSS